MNLITLDFETYYSKDYGLRGLTTEAYIRDPRFQVIGVSLQIANGPIRWFNGWEAVGVLSQIDFTDKAVLSHNTAFDGAILAWRFNKIAGLYLDTMGMAQALHGESVRKSLANLASLYNLGVKGTDVLNAMGLRLEDFNAIQLQQYGEYCKNDVDLTHKLFMRLLPMFPLEELRTIDQALRMFIQPSIVLDTAVLNTHLADVRQKKAELFDELNIAYMTNAEIQQSLSSNQKFADILSNYVTPPTKLNNAGTKRIYAFAKTDKEFTDLECHPNYAVQALVAARLGSKSTIDETRTERFLGIAERGDLPIMLKYYGAHTGRFSGADKVNLQNLPRSGEIRKALCAKPGHALVACDSSQIEARVVAYIAGQQDLVESFREGRDVYCEFASAVFNKPITKADKIERFIGKTCILGLGYGMGDVRFLATLLNGEPSLVDSVDLARAYSIVQLYRSKYAEIAQLWRNLERVIRSMALGSTGYALDRQEIPDNNTFVGYSGSNVILPNQLVIQYPQLGVDKESHGPHEYTYLSGRYGNARTKLYGAKLVENLVQALARIIVVDQMRTIGERYHVCLQVHDEVVITCPEAEVEEAKAYMIKVMSQPPVWAPTLPVACEAGSGPNYGECK